MLPAPRRQESVFCLPEKPQKAACACGQFRPDRLLRPGVRLEKTETDILRPAEIPCLPVVVGGIQQQGSGHQFIQAEARPAAGKASPVLRQSPSRVKGPAVGEDADPAQQSLESGLGGERVDLMDERQKPAHGKMPQYHVRMAQDLRVGNRAPPVSALHLRVRFVDDEGMGPGFPGSPEDVQIVHAEAAAAHRGVVLHLTGHEDDGLPGRKVRRPGGAVIRVVLGEAFVQYQIAQGGGALQQRRMIRVLRQGVENVFQFAGPGGIVIDAFPVHHQRVRPAEIRAQAHGADEAVLHARQGNVRALAGLPGSGVRVGRPDDNLAAPGPRRREGLQHVPEKLRFSAVGLEEGTRVGTLPPAEARAGMEEAVAAVLPPLFGQQVHEVICA